MYRAVTVTLSGYSVLLSRMGGEGKKKFKNSKLRCSMQWPAAKKSPSFTAGVILIFLHMEISIFIVLFTYINSSIRGSPRTPQELYLHASISCISYLHTHI